MRKKIIIANWKMKLDYTDSLQLAKKTKLKLLESYWRNKVVICPDFLSLSNISQILNKTKINLGAQNCFWEDKGAYTGESSIKSLKQLNVKFVILGHSERKMYLKEDLKDIRRKLELVLKYGIIPVVCLGENKEDYKNKQTIKVLKKQFKEIFKNLENVKTKKIVIAYEPIWAIGTGKILEPERISEVLEVLKKEAEKYFSKNKIEKDIYFTYGGSVNSDNVSILVDYKNIEGLLVGSDSLNSKSFFKVCKNFLN
ncbi:triose-phosphate isomerase [bacterium]|nr:triose-phosphate isomerase [bacterium]